MVQTECKYCRKTFFWKDESRKICIQCERLGAENCGDEE